MGVKRKAPGAPPGTCVSVGPTSPGMAQTLLIRDAQSDTSGTPSLSSSGSMQSASPSPSVSGKPLSTTPSQSSSMPLQTSAAGVPGVHVWGAPLTQLLMVRVQAPTPHVVDPRFSSTRPLQSSSTPLHASSAPG